MNGNTKRINSTDENSDEIFNKFERLSNNQLIPIEVSEPSKPNKNEKLAKYSPKEEIEVVYTPNYSDFNEDFAWSKDIDELKKAIIQLKVESQVNRNVEYKHFVSEMKHEIRGLRIDEGSFILNLKKAEIEVIEIKKKAFIDGFWTLLIHIVILVALCFFTYKLADLAKKGVNWLTSPNTQQSSATNNIYVENKSVEGKSTTNTNKQPTNQSKNKRKRRSKNA